MPTSEGDEAIKMYFDMMTASGIWPQRNPTNFYKFKTATSWFLGITMFATFTARSIKDMNNFTKLSEIAYMTIAMFSFLIKLIVITHRRKDLLELIKLIRSPIFHSHPEDLNKYTTRTTRFTNSLGKMYQYSIILCIIFYTLYPMIYKKLPFRFPWDLGRYNYIVFIYQIVSLGVSGWNNSSIDLIMLALIGFSQAQFDILAQKIALNKVEDKREGYDSELDVEILERLKQCVVHHLSIIRFVGIIETVFTVGIFLQYMSTVLILCNIMFHIVLIGTVNTQLLLMIISLSVILIQLFLYCWFGNRLIIKSLAIGNACYFFEWYYCGPKVRKILLIIMERSRRPCAITTLKLSTLSFEAFLAILHWSYSCLTLLIQVYEKRSSQ